MHVKVETQVEALVSFFLPPSLSPSSLVCAGVAVRGSLIAVASLVAEHGLSSCGSQAQ